MTKIPAAIGICAIIALGSAMSACTNGDGNSVANSNGSTSDACPPGVCVGSTPGSTPDSLRVFAP